MEVCTLIEMSNGSRQIQFSKEDVKPNFWVKEWRYIALTSEKIEEIKNTKYQELQQILKTL